MAEADIPRGKCRYCQKPSIHKCSRCNDFYCSKECQDLDWPFHRYICFPKPTLINLNAQIKDVNTPEHGLMEQMHLQENLRHMTLVCREFMTQLNKKCESNVDNIANCTFNIESSSNASNDLKCPTFAEKPIDMKTKGNDNNNNSGNEFQLTSLIDLNKNDMSSCASGSKKNEDEIVYLTAFRSTNRLGVCPKKFMDNNSYQNVLDEIDTYGRSARRLKSSPNLSNFVITYRSNKFARAKIISQTQFQAEYSKFRIEFIDFGNSAYRKLSELREITQKLMDLPIYINVVELTNVELSYSINCLRFLTDFEKKFYKMNIVSKNKYVSFVELFDIGTGEKLNELISKIYPTITETQIENQRPALPKQKAIVTNDSPEQANPEAVPILKAPYKENVFPLSTRNKKAVILDLSLAEHGYISCMFDEHKPILNKVQTYLSLMSKSDDPYKPKHGEYVIAQFEEAWYRGKVIGVLPNDNYEISYTDFLNVATVTSKEIRRYPEELTTECNATLCIIGGLPSRLSNDIKEFLKTEIKINDVIQIDRVIEILDDHVAYIECKELIDKLFEKKLL